MAGRSHFNPKAILIAAAAGLCGTGVYYFGTPVKNFAAETFLTERTRNTLSYQFVTAMADIEKISFLGNEYSIESPTTISAAYGRQNYVYDYTLNTVTVSGAYNDAARVFNFSELDNPDIAQNLKKLGCDLAALQLKRADEFTAEHRITDATEDEVTEYLAAFRAKVGTYQDNFCPAPGTVIP